jgi:general secretion pathway protein G
VDDQNEDCMHQRLGRLRSRRTDEDLELGFTLIELLIVIVILGVLAGIVVFAVQSITSSGVGSSCGTDWKSVQTALEAYRAQMGGYPEGGGVTNSAGTIPPSLAVGSPETGTDAVPNLLTGSDVGGGVDSNHNTTKNNASPSANPVGPWLKEAPSNPEHYSIYVSNDGKGTIVVLDRNGNVAGPAGGTGGNGVSDCNDVP